MRPAAAWAALLSPNTDHRQSSPEDSTQHNLDLITFFVNAYPTAMCAGLTLQSFSTSGVSGEILLLLFIPFNTIHPSFSLPPSRYQDPGSHGTLVSPPLPHYGTRLAFVIVRRLQPFLHSSTPVELRLPTLYRRSQQFIPFFNTSWASQVTAR